MINKSVRPVCVRWFSELSVACRLSENVDAKNRKFKNDIGFPFTYHEEITLVIDHITYLGIGVGRVDVSKRHEALTHTEHGRNLSVSTETLANWEVHVPTVIPGEKVIARVFKNHKGYSQADLISVVDSSLQRIQPACKYFAECSGCQYQMTSIEVQREWKRNQMQSILANIGGIYIDVPNCLGTNVHYGYRTKLTPHFNVPRTHEELKVGFQKRGSKSIIDIDRCIIATDSINEMYTTKRSNLKNDIKMSGLPKKGATLLFREGDNQRVETDPRKLVLQTVSGVQFHYKAGEFFQNNQHALPLLIKNVLEALIGDNCNVLVDVYCGTGLFALSAHNHFKQIYGIEISALAVEAAVMNAVGNNISNVSFMRGSSEKIFAALIEETMARKIDPETTVVLLDPPRKGCDIQFLEQLVAFYPKKIVYVSCDPTTQARDAKYLVENGYKVTNALCFDLFPNTRHIESIITLRR